MSQNLISFQPSPADLTAVDAALKTLEEKLAGLSVEQRSTLMKMGDKSEAFCRKAVEVLGNNPGVLPANFSLAELRRDLAGFDTLRLAWSVLRSFTSGCASRSWRSAAI